MDGIVPDLPFERGPVYRYSVSAGSVWPGIPMSVEAMAYVPDAAAERAATYAATAGLTADYFPIDLTLCAPKQ